MLKDEILKRSPIRVLEKSIHGGLGAGNLGVFTARKGVGKTACLVHVAIDKLLIDQKVLHISFAENPHHIEKWYKQVYEEVAKVYKLENPIENYNQILQNRLIMHFKQNGSQLPNSLNTLKDFCQGAVFMPDIIIVDGFSFYKANEKQFKIWKSFAEEQNTAIWFSATLHRENLKLDPLGIPAPVNQFYDFLSVIIMLVPKQNYIDLSLLKDHDNLDLEKLRLKLDPKTLLIANHRI
jgi:hypothetical protein